MIRATSITLSPRDLPPKPPLPSSTSSPPALSRRLIRQLPKPLSKARAVTADRLPLSTVSSAPQSGSTPQALEDSLDELALALYRIVRGVGAPTPSTKPAATADFPPAITTTCPSPVKLPGSFPMSAQTTSSTLVDSDQEANNSDKPLSVESPSAPSVAAQLRLILQQSDVAEGSVVGTSAGFFDCLVSEAFMNGREGDAAIDKRLYPYSVWKELDDFSHEPTNQSIMICCDVHVDNAKQLAMAIAQRRHQQPHCVPHVPRHASPPRRHPCSGGWRWPFSEKDFDSCDVDDGTLSQTQQRPVASGYTSAGAGQKTLLGQHQAACFEPGIVPPNGTQQSGWMPTQDRDFKTGVKINEFLQTITDMPIYRNASLEELRLRDYEQNRRRPYGFGGATGDLSGSGARPAQQLTMSRGFFDNGSAATHDLSAPKASRDEQPLGAWSPSMTQMSVHASWWGYSIYLPPPVMKELDNNDTLKRVAALSAALDFILKKLPTLFILSPPLLVAVGFLRGLAPIVGYVASFISYSWTHIRSFDRGHGVVLSATWALPVALIPRTWDVPASAASSADALQSITTALDAFHFTKPHYAAADRNLELSKAPH